MLALFSGLAAAGCGVDHGPGTGDAGVPGDDARVMDVDTGLDADVDAWVERPDAPDAATDPDPDAGPPPYDPTRLDPCVTIEPRSVLALSRDGSLAALGGTASIDVVDTSDGHTVIAIGLPSPGFVVLGFTRDALLVAEQTVLARYELATGARTTTALHNHSGVGAGIATAGGAILIVDGVVEEVALGGTPRTIRSTLGPTPQQVLELPSGDLLLVASDRVSIVARTDGTELAHASGSLADGFGAAARLDDGTLVVTRTSGLSVFDAGLSLLATPSRTALALAATGMHLAVPAAGGLEVLAVSRVGSVVSLASVGTVAVDASGDDAAQVIAAAGVIAASTASGALVVVSDAGLAVRLRREALAVDGSVGVALLDGHRVVTRQGVVDLDALSLVLDFAAPASAVLGTSDGSRAAAVHGGSVDLVDRSLATTTLPLPGSGALLALAPDGSAIAAATGTSLTTLRVAGGATDTHALRTSALALALAPDAVTAWVATVDHRIDAIDGASGAVVPLRTDVIPGALAVSIDGASLAASTGGGPMLVFDLAAGTSTTLAVASGPIAFGDQGRWLFSADGGALWATPVDGHVARVRVAQPGVATTALAVANDGELVVLGTSDGLRAYCAPESTLHP